MVSLAFGSMVMLNGPEPIRGNAALVRRYTGQVGNKNKGKREEKKQAKPKPTVAPGRKA